MKKITFKYPVRTLIGVIATSLSIIGFIVLIVQAARTGTAWHIVSFCIYALSLITVWTISTLYHSLDVSPKTNRTLEQLDHAMIYLLIAGTYTPICLVVLRGGWGWSLFGVNWALAITGIILKLCLRHPSRGVIATLFTFYILMGWLILIAWRPLIQVFPGNAIFWLVLGGLFYTGGAVIFSLRRLNFVPNFGAHEIWHLFVLAGSVSHFWMMFKYVSVI